MKILLFLSAFILSVLPASAMEVLFDRATAERPDAYDLVCRPWRKGANAFPGREMLFPRRDWTGFDRLVFSFVNEGEGADTLRFFLGRAEGPDSNRLSWKDSMPSSVWRDTVIPLIGWPKDKLDRADAGRLYFFVGYPKSAGIRVQRVLLLKRGEPVPAPPEAWRAGANCDRRAAQDREHLVSYSNFVASCRDSGTIHGRMALGKASSMRHVRPRDAFSAAPLDRLDIRLARGEYESVQVVVAATDGDLENASVRAGALRSDTGVVFPAADISVAVVGYVHTDYPPVYLTRTESGEKVATDFGWWPDPLLGYLAGADIRGHDVQSFWLTVHAPDGLEPGIYRGSVLVGCRGMASRRVPISVRVNRFRMPKVSPLPLAINFHPQYRGVGLEKTETKPLRDDTCAAHNRWKAHKDEWVDFLADHFVTMDSIYRWSPPDYGVLERLRRQGRLGMFNIVYWDASYPQPHNRRKWQDSMKGRMESGYEWARTNNLLDHAYVYGCDENNPPAFPMIAEAAEFIKTNYPAAVLLTTARDRNYGVGSALGRVDWFCPFAVWYDPGRAAKARLHGHRVWWYTCGEWSRSTAANFNIEYEPIVARMLMGAMAVRNRPDGYLYYELAAWNGLSPIADGPFTRWDPRSCAFGNGDGSLVYPGPDARPLTTVRFENFRDGIEDFAYAEILRRHYDSGDGNADWRAKVKSLLEVPSQIFKTVEVYRTDPEPLVRWRDAMADAIESVE